MEDLPPGPSDPFPTSPPSPPPPSEPALPWEQPGLGVFQAFGQTLAMLFGSPRKAFERMQVTGAFGRPLVFAIVVGWIAVLAGTFWNLLLRGWVQEFVPWAGERWGDISAVARIVGAMTAPLWLPIGLLVGACITHLFLILVGGAKRGFAATFRVQCYAGATMLLAVIPACGQVVGLVWSLVLSVIGLSAAHRISTGKAALAVLLPLLLCCGCMALGVALFGAAILAALGRHG